MNSNKDVKIFLKNVGLAIRARRTELGWTLEEVEANGYPSWRHLQKIEAGKNITLATLWNIAKVLEVDPAVFLKNKR